MPVDFKEMRRMVDGIRLQYGQEVSIRKSVPTRLTIENHWKPIFKSAFDRQLVSNGCFRCGMVGKNYNPERAHIVALCERGTNDVGNLWNLCSECHRESEMMHPDLKTYWVGHFPLLDRWLWESFNTVYYMAIRNENYDKVSMVFVGLMAMVQRALKLSEDEYLSEFVDIFGAMLDQTAWGKQFALEAAK